MHHCKSMIISIYASHFFVRAIFGKVTHLTTVIADDLSSLSSIFSYYSLFSAFSRNMSRLSTVEAFSCICTLFYAMAWLFASQTYSFLKAFPR